MQRSSSAYVKNKGAKRKLVLIGGSAGSIELVITLLSSLPKELNFPVVIILHRMRNIASSLEKIFSARSRVSSIKEADEKEKLENGVVYIAPSNYHLLFEEDGCFALDYSEPVNYSRPSIDVSFESAANVYKDKLVAILLSGANNDGSEGLCHAHFSGALTVVQDPAEAEYDAMPKAALKKLEPDMVLKVSEICKLLKDLNTELK